jgi:diaminopropionate ammonia-lyase
MRALAGAGVVAGETGAAGVGGLFELLTQEHATAVREMLQITPATRVLVLSTEGATDPEAYARILGRAA